VINSAKGGLSLLPSVPLGDPPPSANREARSMRSFLPAWIPHDDVILPLTSGDCPLGLSDAADPPS